MNDDDQVVHESHMDVIILMSWVNDTKSWEEIGAEFRLDAL